jgi:hypothetical protein
MSFLTFFFSSQPIEIICKPKFMCMVLHSLIHLVILYGLKYIFSSTLCT